MIRAANRNSHLMLAVITFNFESIRINQILCILCLDQLLFKKTFKLTFTNFESDNA